MSKINTPYDDVFRTLLNDCSALIIPLINEAFGESYTGEEEIIFSPNEHFLNRQDGKEEERVTDSSFKIVILNGLKKKKYHWECQSSADSSMLVRFFEYDTQIALDEGSIEGNVLTVTFPHSAVLFLRCRQNTPDKMKVVMELPGTNASYEIPVMKSQKYTISEIFEKKLFFLIPFYLFSYENRLKEYNRNEKKLEELKMEYEDIKNRLEKQVEEKKMNEYTKCTLIDMSNKVLEHLAKNYENVRKGVKSVMGGKVLDYEAKTIRNEGISIGIEIGTEKGREKGREEGKKEGIINTASILQDLEYSEEDIVDKITEKYKMSDEQIKKILLKAGILKF